MRIEIKNIQESSLICSELSVSSAMNAIVKYGAHNIKSYHIHFYPDAMDEDSEETEVFYSECCELISQLIEASAKLISREDTMMIRVSSIAGFDISMKGSSETLKTLPLALPTLIPKRKEPLELEVEIRMHSEDLSRNAIQDLSKQNFLEVDLKALLDLLSNYSATEKDYRKLIDHNLKSYYENPKFDLIDELIKAYSENTLEKFSFRKISHASLMEVFNQKENPAALNLLSLFLNQVFLRGRTEAIFLGIDETIRRQMTYIDSLIRAEEGWKESTDNLRVLRMRVFQFLRSPLPSDIEQYQLLGLLIQISQQLSLSQYLKNPNISRKYQEGLQVFSDLIEGFSQSSSIKEYLGNYQNVLVNRGGDVQYIDLKDYDERSDRVVWSFDRSNKLIEHLTRFYQKLPSSLMPIYFVTQEAFSIESMNNAQYTPIGLLGLSNEAFVFHDNTIYSIGTFFSHDLRHLKSITRNLSKVAAPILRLYFQNHLKQSLLKNISPLYHPLIEMMDFDFFHEHYKFPWVGILDDLEMHKEASYVENLLHRLDGKKSEEVKKDFYLFSYQEDFLQNVLHQLNISHPSDLPKDMLALVQDLEIQKQFIRELFKHLVPSIRQALEAMPFMKT